MASTAYDRLDKLRELNTQHDWVNKDLYRLLFKPELHILAYEKIKSAPGNMTKGSDGRSIDGTSIKHITDTIKALMDESYQPEPAVRVYIPKKNGKMRPLGIPAVKDKIVQESVRLILECIYDSPKGPMFCESSHGFREAKSTHSALQEVAHKWGGTKWFIEGDIKSFFDEINHERLISLLSKKISDDRFLNLIRKFLGAGYLEGGSLKASGKGTPQGGIISPMLANIYLHEFDIWAKGKCEALTKGADRRPNPEYRSVSRKRSYLLNKCQGNPTGDDLVKFRELDARLINIPAGDQYDPNYVRVRYVRYADDWMIGITGSKELATEIRMQAGDFLRDVLKLELSIEKTKITHCSGRARFLGFLIGAPVYKNVLRRKIKGAAEHSHLRRTSNSQIRLWLDKDELINTLRSERFIKTKSGKDFAISKRSYVHLDPDEIVLRYSAIKRGWRNYYRPAMNIRALGYVDYMMRFSLAKTLAHKYRTSMKQQFRMRGRSLKVMRDVNGKVRTTQYWECDYAKDVNGFMVNPRDPDSLIKRYQRRVKSKLGMDCCVCGSKENTQMHHIRHLRKGGKVVVKGFNRILADINRKQIPVCHGCHVQIHAGKYDGKSLKDLHYNPALV